MSKYKLLICSTGSLLSAGNGGIATIDQDQLNGQWFLLKGDQGELTQSGSTIKPIVTITTKADSVVMASFHLSMRPRSTSDNVTANFKIAVDGYAQSTDAVRVCIMNAVGSVEFYPVSGSFIFTYSTEAVHTYSIYCWSNSDFEYWYPRLEVVQIVEDSTLGEFGGFEFGFLMVSTLNIMVVIYAIRKPRK